MLTLVSESQQAGRRIAELRAAYPQDLSHGHRQLRGISSRLAASPGDRAAFLRQPAAYLKQSGLDVGSATLVSPPVSQLQTSEACTWLAVCVWAVAAAAAWLVVAVGSYEFYSFVHCDNLAWGNCIKHDDQLSPFYPRMTSSVV
jgi:hypothetical protein